HTGMVPTSLLLPQVVDAVDVPVVAAGGFFDGRGLVAALAYGAAGVAMGTRFLLTKESTVPDNVKGIYVQKSVTDTVVSRHIDGLPQRVIRTDVVDSLERSGRLTALPRAARNAFAFRKLTDTSLRDLLAEGLAMKKRQGLTWGQMVMAANAPMMTRAAMVEGRPEVGILATGPGVGANALGRRVVGRVVAGRVRGSGRQPDRVADLRGGVLPGRCPRPGEPERHLPARADHHRARHGRAEDPLPPDHGRRRRDLV